MYIIYNYPTRATVPDLESIISDAKNEGLCKINYEDRGSLDCPLQFPEAVVMFPIAGSRVQKGESNTTDFFGLAVEAIWPLGTSFID